MSIKKRAVSVRQLPRDISPDTEMELLHGLRMAVEAGHLRFVLDCSNLVSMDSSAVRLLLSCLEEAMKHNGDVRLAMLHPEAYKVLQEMGVGRLFESYQTTESAIRSYQLRPSSLAPLSSSVAHAYQDTEYAA
jgi:anti-anti-sigma factor